MVCTRSKHLPRSELETLGERRPQHYPALSSARTARPGREADARLRGPVSAARTALAPGLGEAA